MPLPSDEKLIALSQDILKQFDTIFGLHPGFRPAHAQGCHASGNIYTFSRRSFANAGASHHPQLHTGHSAVFQLHRPASDSG